MRKNSGPVQPLFGGIQVVVNPYLPAGQVYMASAMGGRQPMLMSGTMAGIQWEPSPADLYPEAAAWALKVLELADKGEITLEPTETAIRLGQLCGLSGFVPGSIVCLREEHHYEEAKTLWPHVATAQFPAVREAYRKPETLPRLSLGIVLEGSDMALPLVGFTRVRGWETPNFPSVNGRPSPLPGDKPCYERGFSTRVCVPYSRLAVVREPDGEAGGIDYLSEKDQRRLLVFRLTEEYRKRGLTAEACQLYPLLTEDERIAAVQTMHAEVRRDAGLEPQWSWQSLKKSFEAEVQ